MSSFSDDMSDRFMFFVVNIIKLEKQLCKTFSGRHIYGQLFRAGTSSGANYEEARAGESRADFIHKMKIAAKEADETQYWLSLCEFGAAYPDCNNLQQKLEEIQRLLNAILGSAKRKNPISQF